MELNKEQRLAAEHVDGPCIVTAIPGSGKTATLTARIIRLIEKGISPSNLLCLTFTNKAAEEMRVRIQERVGDLVGGLWIGTFHSFCVAVLRKAGKPVNLGDNFTIRDARDQIEVMSKAARAQGFENLSESNIRHLCKLIDDLRENAQPISDLDDYDASGVQPDAAQIIKRFLTELDNKNSIDFTGLLYLTYRLLDIKPEVADKLSEQFRYISVDEGQDTSTVQYEILKRIAKHGNLFVVADVQQCVHVNEPVYIDEHLATKPAYSVEVGDHILSCAGDGRLARSKVLAKQITKKARKQTVVRTTGGQGFTCTHNHQVFCRRGDSWASKYPYFVYLMRRGPYFRVGTSRFYSRNDRSPSLRNGFSFRCRCEKADAGWILSYHETEEDARYNEKVISCKYCIPTEVFQKRPGLILDQDRIDDLHKTISQFYRLDEMKAELGVEIDWPHWKQEDIRCPTKTVMTITLVGANSNSLPCHRYSIRSGNESVIRRLELLGYNFSSDSKSYCLRKTKRHDGSRANLSEILNIWEVVRSEARAAGSEAVLRKKAKILRGAAMVSVAACSLVAGDQVASVIPSDDLGKPTLQFDTVSSVENGYSSEDFVDFEVERTNNFITGGIVHSNSIYGWRHAKPENLAAIEEDFSNVKKVVLTTNYRSTNHILKCAQNLIQHNPGGQGVKLVSDRGDGHEVMVKRVRTPEEEATLVARYLSTCREKLGFEWHQMSVMYRAHMLSRQMEVELRSTGIPYRIIGGPSFYDRKESKIIMSYLSLITNWNDSISFARAVMNPRRAIGEKFVAEVEAIADDEHVTILEACDAAIQRQIGTQKARENLLAFVDLIREFAIKDKNRVKPSVLVQNIINKSGYPRALEELANRGDSEAESRLAGISAFVKGVEVFESQRESCSLRDYLYKIQLSTSEDDAAAGNKVTLTTVHAAKGREWPVTSIIGAEQGMIPHNRSRTEREKQEERRLFYVAITRAKDVLMISNCAYRSRMSRGRSTPYESRPSQFIEECGLEIMPVKAVGV